MKRRSEGVLAVASADHGLLCGPSVRLTESDSWSDYPKFGGAQQAGTDHDPSRSAHLRRRATAPNGRT